MSRRFGTRGTLSRSLVAAAVSWAIPMSAYPQAPPPSDASEDGLAEARRLFKAGKARYETLDYDGAIDLWTKAYAQLPDGEAAAAVRNRLVYNLATAQEKAYDIDKDVERLRTAKGLLERYIESYKSMHQPTAKAKKEVDKAHERIDELERRIAEAERKPAAPATAATAPKGPAPADLEQQKRNAELRDKSSKAQGLIIAGWVVLAVGGVSLLVAAGSFGGGEADGANQSRARGAGWGALGLGIAGVATGGALLGVGYKRRREAQQALVPSFGRGFAGMSYTVRF